jgi:protein ImuB
VPAAVSRLACIHVPALPLQVLVQQHPDWMAHPVAVVDADKPQGVVQWVNERAYRSRILPGMRFSAALALHADLRAGTVAPAAIDQAVRAALSALQVFSPAIEPNTDEPGVFWLDASGLGGLFPDLSAWAEGAAGALHALGLRGIAVVAGFDRFCTYALAHARRGVCVLRDASEERAAADRVPLHRLRLEPALRDALTRLGVRDVGGFAALRPAELAARFSPAAARAQRDAAGTATTPLQAHTPRAPVCTRYHFEPGTHGVDAQALLAAVDLHLTPLCAKLAARGRAASALHLRVLVDRHPPTELHVAPAVPTLATAQLLDLLRLRLSAAALPGEVAGFELHLDEGDPTPEQLQLFGTGKHRDLAAGNRALARLRAEFGDDAVVHARPADGHLPQAQFAWQPCARLQASNPRPVLIPRLVRRLLAQPQPLARQHAGDDGWFISRLNFGPVQNMFGPYVMSGGWWRQHVHREYYFAHTRRGDVAWVFYDRVRRRWCAQGGIE